MDVTKMIAELQDEKDRLDEAILALERLAAGKNRRRGRPPGWLKGDGPKDNGLKLPPGSEGGGSSLTQSKKPDR